MVAQDVLADEVEPRAAVLPALLPIAVEECRVGAPVSERRDVVGERVEPDVDRVPGVPGKWNAPSETRAAHREIAQAALDEGANLVATRSRTHALGIAVVPVEQGLLIAR